MEKFVTALRSRRTSFRMAGVITVGALMAGCSTPNPNSAAGRSESAGQSCAVCIYKNPGDGAPCYAICSQRVEDEATYQKAYQR